MAFGQRNVNKTEAIVEPLECQTSFPMAEGGGRATPGRATPRLTHAPDVSQYGR